MLCGFCNGCFHEKLWETELTRRGKPEVGSALCVGKPPWKGIGEEERERERETRKGEGNMQE